MRDQRWYLPLGLILFVGLTAGLALAQGPAVQAPVGSAFTYQGRLTDAAGIPVDDVCDLRFSLWDDAMSGAQVGSTVQVPGLDLEGGLFSTPLDFGAVFDGTALWLKVEVKCSADVAYVALDPRQPLTAAPYTLHALDADLLEGQPASAFAGASHAHSATDIISDTLATDRYSAYDDLGDEGYLGNAAGDLAKNNGILQASLNADLLDGRQASDFARVGRYAIPGGGGSVAIPFPHYNAFQVTIGEAYASPQKVAWLSAVENDGDLAWLAIDSSGAVSTGTCDLDNTTQILTLGANITLSCPGNGNLELNLTSSSEDVRAFLVW
jgi:hypothetical protein